MRKNLIENRIYKIHMLSKTNFIVAVLALFFLAGCTTKNEEPTQTSLPPTSTPLPVSVSILTSDAPVHITATPTQTPKPVLPPIRTPDARASLPPEGTVEFHILHWNDFHGELGEHSIDGTWVPGAARLAAFVKSEKERYDPNEVLILDAGDWFEGSKYSVKSRGGKVLEFYQRLGVNAVTVGNHDLFLGAPRFYEIVSQAAPIEILSVNLRKTGPNRTCSNQGVLSPYKIFELGNAQGSRVRVAVIGVSLHHLEVEAYSPITGVCFSNPEDEIIKIYDQLMETERPDVLVALSHSGIDSDRKLAEALNAVGKPVDIIIGGHSHTWMESPEKVGNTTIISAGELGRAVGVFDLTYDRATSTLDVKWREEIFSACSPEDPDTLAFLRDTLPYSNPKQKCTLSKDPANDYLVDLSPAFESVGYWTLGEGVFPATDTGMVTHQVISSHAKEYPYGLFAHAPSELKYALDGKYSTFVTEISIKETACGDGASFVVSIDDNEIYHSEQMLSSNKPIPLTLDISGGEVLKLVTISGEDMSCDWTIWGDPYLVRK